MIIAQVVWLALPVILAASVHMVIVKQSLFARLAVPIDGGRSISGRRIFGDNKTWRGVVFVPIASALFAALLGLFAGAAAARGLMSIDTAAVATRLGAPPPPLSHALAYAAIGAVFGLGYILGELPNSFVKRRFSISPGGRGAGFFGPFFFVMDRCDSVLGAFLLGALVFSYPLEIGVAAIICLPLVHLAISAALYRARLKRSI
jgi:hypothetical protein